MLGAQKNELRKNNKTLHILVWWWIRCLWGAGGTQKTMIIRRKDLWTNQNYF